MPPGTGKFPRPPSSAKISRPPALGRISGPAQLPTDPYLNLNRPDTSKQETAAARNANVTGRLAQIRESRESGRILYCKKHPNVPAEKRCDLCDCSFCNACVSEVRKQNLCTECARPGGRTQVLPVVALEIPQTFTERLSHSFIYPLLQDQKFLLMGGAPLIWLAFCVHWLAGLAVSFAVALWLMKIVRLTALRKEDDPTMLSFGRASDDLVKPGGFLFLAILTSIAPALIYLPLGNPDLTSHIAHQISATLSIDEPAPVVPTPTPDVKKPDDKNAESIVSRIAHDSTLKILLAIGLFLFPMGLSMAAIFPVIDAVSPPMLINAIVRLAPYYAVVLIIVALGLLPAWFIMNAIDSFKELPGLAATGLVLYFSMAAGHAFGSIRAADFAVFNWVGLPTAKA